MSRHVPTPLLVLATGFSFSLAANILWCWPGGPIRILGGALASVALPAAVHMWPLVPAADLRSRSLRNVVITAIAVLAAVTTFAHASSLLVAAGESPWLARGYPVITELLVVFAILARRSPAAAAAHEEAAAPVAAPVRKTAPQQRPCRGEMKSPGVAVPTPAATPVVVPVSDAVSAHRGARTDRAGWLRAQPDMAWSKQVEAVESQFGVSRSTAKRVVAEATEKAAS